MQTLADDVEVKGIVVPVENTAAVADAYDTWDTGNAYNPQAAEAVMCRNMISVHWDGGLYDCDFNQMLELPLDGRAPQTVFDWDEERLQERSIVIGEHCFGCTAGGGSSCTGQTT